MACSASIAFFQAVQGALEQYLAARWHLKAEAQCEFRAIPCTGKYDSSKRNVGARLLYSPSGCISQYHELQVLDCAWRPYQPQSQLVGVIIAERNPLILYSIRSSTTAADYCIRVTQSCTWYPFNALYPLACNIRKSLDMRELILLRLMCFIQPNPSVQCRNTLVDRLKRAQFLE